MQLKSYYFKVKFVPSEAFRGEAFEHMTKEYDSEQNDADIYDMFVELLTLWFREKKLYRHFVTASGDVRTQRFYDVAIQIWFDNREKVNLDFNLSLIDQVEDIFRNDILVKLNIDIYTLYKIEDMRIRYLNVYVMEKYHYAFM